MTYQGRKDEILGGSWLHQSQAQCIEPQPCGERSKATQNRHRNDWIPRQRSIQCVCDGHVEGQLGSLDLANGQSSSLCRAGPGAAHLISENNIKLGLISAVAPPHGQKRRLCRHVLCLAHHVFENPGFRPPPQAPLAELPDISWSANLHGIFDTWRPDLEMTGPPATHGVVENGTVNCRGPTRDVGQTAPRNTICSPLMINAFKQVASLGRDQGQSPLIFRIVSLYSVTDSLSRNNRRGCQNERGANF